MLMLAAPLAEPLRMFPEAVAEPPLIVAVAGCRRAGDQVAQCYSAGSDKELCVCADGYLSRCGAASTPGGSQDDVGGVNNPRIKA